MGKTYLTGPPKWRCENCGRFNTMREKPSPGHSVRKQCSWCDNYQNVTIDKDYSQVAILTLVVISIGIFGSPAIAFWAIVSVLMVLGKLLPDREDGEINIEKSIDNKNTSDDGDISCDRNKSEITYKSVDLEVSDQNLNSYQVKEKERFGDLVYVCGGCGSDVTRDDTKCSSCKCKLIHD